MRLKKKKGSTLIAVLFIFAILSISSLSILSLTVADYNLRITASKKVQSLYSSDSGVNVVYGIMKNVISQGVQTGNKAVADYMSAFNQYSSTNLEPLKGTYSYLYSADGSLDTDKIKIKLNDIFQVSYKDYISDYINSSKNDFENGRYTDLSNNIISLYNTSDAGNIPTITVTDKEANPNQWKVFGISSQFLTNPINGQTSNKKIVQADIAINIPNYQDSYFVETKKQQITSNNVWKNAISIDGDMHINSDITVNGDVFVLGKPPVITNVSGENVSTKYNGGIAIGSDDTNAIEANFNQNVVTANSFNISGQGKTVNVGGNIYAGNVYIGKSNSSATTDTSNCKLTVNNQSENEGMVYTDNDLSLYATKSHIVIGKYYGINDIGDVAQSKRAGDKDYNSSSSIIVNTDDIGAENGSTINIGDAIINGSAYINTNTPYQTGESVAIKGNYVAYTIPIPQSTGASDDEAKYDENHVEFVYNDPLQLVNNFKDPNTNLTSGPLNGADKADYFRRIAALPSTTPPIVLKKSGIIINNLLFSAGVALSNGSITTKSIDIGQSNLITSRQMDFAKTVYDMGINSASVMNDYTQGKVNRDVFAGSGVDNDASNKIPQVDLSGVDDSTVVDNNSSEAEVISKSKNVVLLGAGSTYKPDSINDEVIDLTKMNSNPHGIIITQKNVILSGTINFTGTIIGGGDLTIVNDGPNTLKTLTYDDNYVMKTIARDYTDTYSKVFNIIPGMPTQIVEVAASVGKNANGTSNIIDGGLVKLSNWRVSN